MSSGYPTAEVTDSLPYAQDNDQPINVKLFWTRHHSGAFNLSIAHAVALRNALDTKLAEIDEAALARIDAHLEALEAAK